MWSKLTYFEDFNKFKGLLFCLVVGINSPSLLGVKKDFFSLQIYVEGYTLLSRPA